jgi:antitoxin ParD1/3/4
MSKLYKRAKGLSESSRPHAKRIALSASKANQHAHQIPELPIKDAVLPTASALYSSQETHTRTAMAVHNVSLSPDLESLVRAKVESGRCQNAADVIGAAVRTLDREERAHEAKLAALRSAIEEGDASGPAARDSFSRVRQALNIPENQDR